jgi:hypothetical protein
MVGMMGFFGGMLALGLAFMLLIFILVILVFIFWISMLIDCIQRKFKDGSDKIAWVLVIILTGIIGALIYFSIVKVKDKKK